MGLSMMNNQDAPSSFHDVSTSSLNRIRLRGRSAFAGIRRSSSMPEDDKQQHDNTNEDRAGSFSTRRFTLSRPKLKIRSQSLPVEGSSPNPNPDATAAVNAGTSAGNNDDNDANNPSPTLSNSGGKKRPRRRLSIESLLRRSSHSIQQPPQEDAGSCGSKSSGGHSGNKDQQKGGSINSGEGSGSAESRPPKKKLSLNFLSSRRRSRSSLKRPIEVECSDSDSSGNQKGGSFTEESDEDSNFGTSLFSRTKIIPECTTPDSIKSNKNGDSGSWNKFEEEGEGVEVEAESGLNVCATAILKHSYFENLCGANAILADDSSFPDLPLDPTVQESIECIFASQLEDGLELWDEDELENETEEEFKHGSEGLMSPAIFQQSRQNRSDRGSTSVSEHTSLSQSKQRYQQASLVYVGTYDPTIADSEKPTTEMMSGHDTTLLCPCARSQLPSCPPKDWAQSPLLLRPTAGKGMKVKGVRLSDSKEYLWEPGSNLSWEDVLAKKWGKPFKPKPHYACCEKCAVLPINNGNEDIGKALVTDFETDLFEGTLLLRLRFSHGTTPEPYDDGKGYFRGMNRRYQAVVRGRFKKNLPLTELVTGFRLDRPCGKLPAKLILRGGLKVVKFFAPQLDAKLEGDYPHCFTPLGSTPQSISVDTRERDLIDGIREEPGEASRTLLGQASLAKASIQRARNRKKEFDKLYVNNAKDPKTDPSKIYTFEFLQHLFDFEDFSIELGSMLGNVELEHILDGQPLQIMASYGSHPLFSFDVWHKCLWEKAQKHAST